MSLLGKVFGGIAKGVAGFATGGPAGAIQGILGKQKAAVLTTRPDSTIYQEQRYGPGGAFGSTKTMKIYTTPLPQEPGPYGGVQLPALVGTGAACPVGYRLNKSTYITRGGGTSRWGPAGAITVHPKGSTCVKRRRRNVGNARALRRAISRVRGFVKLSRKAYALAGPRRKTKTKLLGPGGTSIVNVD